MGRLLDIICALIYFTLGAVYTLASIELISIDPPAFWLSAGTMFLLGGLFLALSKKD